MTKTVAATGSIMSHKGPMRLLWLAAGLTACALGLIGAVLPLLPTTPFMLLAAFCFARSSPRLERWLTEHRLFGPAIADWRRNGAISRRAKQLATVMIAATFLLSLLLGVASWVLAIQALALSGVLLFIWTRPDPQA